MIVCEAWLELTTRCISGRTGLSVAGGNSGSLDLAIGLGLEPADPGVIKMDTTSEAGERAAPAASGETETERNKYRELA